MPTILHGIDLVECDRIARILTEHRARFLERILTPKERERAAAYASDTTFIAGRFAAKEAILKMLGTGWRGGIAWTDMEILPDDLGQPVVTLTGETARIARERGVESVLISITHTRNHAAASAIGLGGFA